MPDIVTTLDPVYAQLGIEESTATSIEVTAVTNSVLWAERSVRRYLRYDPVRRTRTEFYPQIDLGYISRFGVWDANDTQAFIREVASAVTDELQLRHLPIRSIDQLFLDYDARFGKRAGAFAIDTLKTEGDDYWARYDGLDDDSNPICRDGILLSEGRWPSTPGCLKIVYVAGYSADEFTGVTTAVDAVPIYEAVVFEAARKAKQAILLSKNSGNSSSTSSTGSGWTAGSIQSERLGDYSYSIGASAGGTNSSSSGTSGGLYDGVMDIATESMERLADYVNVGYSLVG